MPVSKSSKALRSSKRKPPKVTQAAFDPSAAWWEIILAFTFAAAAGTLAAIFFFHGGYTLYYGDAEAHLNIARRIVDSHQPGYVQWGTVWLPLPHLLMTPFARIDSLWH